MEIFKCRCGEHLGYFTATDIYLFTATGALCRIDVRHLRVECPKCKKIAHRSRKK